MSERILCQGHFQDNDTRVTGLNNNDAIIGPSGARKTRGYNPLMYVRRDKKTGCCVEQDIFQIAAALSPVESRSDPFWEHMTQLALSVMISYVLEYLPYREQHLGSVVRLVREMGTGSFDALLGEVCEIAPESFTAVQYKMNVSDTDRSMDTLASLLYTQTLQVLCRYADSQPERRLRVPVRFIMDDFAASSANCIENFDQITSVIRSREISVSIILQSLSQLEAAYGTSRAVTILNNCDNLLYLGGQDVETARYIGAKANKTMHTILDMPLDSAWLFTRGKQPREVKKYRLESHPRYVPEKEGRAETVL